MEPPRTFLNKTGGLNYSPAIPRLWSSDRCAVHHLNNRGAVPGRAAVAERRRPRLAAPFCKLFSEIALHVLRHYPSSRPSVRVTAPSSNTESCAPPATPGPLRDAGEPPSVATKWEARDGVPGGGVPFAFVCPVAPGTGALCKP